MPPPATQEEGPKQLADTETCITNRTGKAIKLLKAFDENGNAVYEVNNPLENNESYIFVNNINSELDNGAFNITLEDGTSTVIEKVDVGYKGEIVIDMADSTYIAFNKPKA